MKCPLAAIGEPDIDNIIENKAFDCLKEECAWWDDEGEQCGIRSLIASVVNLTAIMMTIEDKMPHEEQFRR